RVSTSEAHALLTAFLDASATDASLHPNALLTEAGPITASTGANTGLVLHNLKRVQAGLEGKHLAAELTLKDLDADSLPNSLPIRNGKLGEEEGLEPATVEVKPGGNDDWQDKGEYEREQSITRGEIGPRDNAIDARIDAENPVPGGLTDRIPKVADSSKKEARKRGKKERRTQEKKAREAAREAARKRANDTDDSD
ncbi:MAG: hypothetical protein Q9190_006295, partial [Brigantiaea leucoxantha]